MNIQRLAFSVAAAACLTGCAVSAKRFYADPYSLNDLQLCRTYDKASRRSASQFAQDVQSEVDRRNLTPERCHQLEIQQNVAIGAVAVLTTAVVIAARKSGGVGGSVGTYDTEWDWDEFYRGGVLVWECRGVQTGQFATPDHCAGLPMTDWRWPNK